MTDTTWDRWDQFARDKMQQSGWRDFLREAITYAPNAIGARVARPVAQPTRQTPTPSAVEGGRDPAPILDSTAAQAWGAMRHRGGVHGMEPPTITGGGTGNEPAAVPFSSRAIVRNNPSVEGAETIGRTNYQPNMPAPANENARGPVAVNIERPSVERVLGVLRDLDVPVGNVRRHGADNTAYIDVPDPATGQTVVIRVSADGHVGFPKGKRLTEPNYFDTGSLPMDRPLRDPSVIDPAVRQARIDRVTRNEGGGLYADMDNLRDAIAWRFSRDLVPPEQAPRTQRIPRDTPEAPPPQSAADPAQPRLLSSSIPIWAAALASLGAEPQQETDPAVGRFAEPRIRNRDAELVANTQAMTAAVGGEADAIEATVRKRQSRLYEPQTPWDQFERVD